MSILGTIFSVGSSAVTGGLFGLIGSLLGSALEIWKTKQANDFKLKEWDHELALQELQMRARQEETEQEIHLAAEKGSWDGLVSSQQAMASERPSYAWVDAFKSVTRPGITWMFVVYIGVLMVRLDGAAQLALLDALTFMAMTSISWWFGDRAPHQQAQVAKVVSAAPKPKVVK